MSTVDWPCTDHMVYTNVPFLNIKRCEDFTEEHLKSWILDVSYIFFKYCENLDGEVFYIIMLLSKKINHGENLDGKRKSTPPMSCAEDRLKEESFSTFLFLFLCCV